MSSCENETFLVIFIDREAGEIIRLVASICPSVCPSVFTSGGVQNCCISNLLLFRQVAPSRWITLLIAEENKDDDFNPAEMALTKSPNVIKCSEISPCFHFKATTGSPVRCFDKVTTTINVLLIL